MKPGTAAESRWIAAGADALLVGALALVSVPLCPGQYFAAGMDSLDEGYMIALSLAFERSLEFGREAVFTYGPYTFATTGRYLPATHAAALAVTGLLALVTGSAAAAMGRAAGLRLLPRAVWLAALFAMMTTTDSFFQTPALLLAGAAFLPWERTRGATLALAAVAGLASLAKFSIAVVTLPALAATCLRPGVGTRQRLAVLGTFALSWFAAWIFAGQSPSTIPRYFASSIEVARGYEAMSYEGPVSATVRIVAAAGIATAAAFVLRPRERRLPELAAVACVAAIAFVLEHHGLVRSDPFHWIAAASSLAVLLAVLVACAPAGRRLHCSLLLAAFAAAASGLGFRDLVAGLPHRAAVALAGLADAAQGGERNAARHRERVEAARSELPDEDLRGTADVFPWGQGLLLGREDRLRIRPMPQSYSAYTPRLAQMNADFFDGPEAPDHVFARVAPIDGRLATLEDPLAWISLLSRYRPAGRTMRSKHCRLDLRDRPLARRTEPVSEHAVARDEWLPVPVPAAGLVVAEVTVESTLRSRVRGFLHKQAPVALVIRTDGGTEHEFRLPEHMGESGFVISPLVLRDDDLAVLYAAAEGVARPDPASVPRDLKFRLYGGSRDTIRVRFSKVIFGPR